MRLTTDVEGSQSIRIEQYNNLREEARASSYLLAYGDTTTVKIYVSSGITYFGGDIVEFAGGQSALISEPSASNRIDVHSLQSSGYLAITTGVEDDSPTLPSIPSGELPICFVYNRAGQLKIDDTDGGGSDGYVYKDIRPTIKHGEVSGYANVSGSRAMDTVYQNTSGKWRIAIVSFGMNTSGGTSNSGGQAQIGVTSTPITVVAYNRQHSAVLTGWNNTVWQTMTFLIPPNYYYRIATWGIIDSTIYWWEGELGY